MSNDDVSADEVPEDVTDDDVIAGDVPADEIGGTADPTDVDGIAEVPSAPKYLTVNKLLRKLPTALNTLPIALPTPLKNLPTLPQKLLHQLVP